MRMSDWSSDVCSSDLSTGHDHSPDRDDEAEPDYRFTLANERTFLAWIRTALALIAGGIAVVQFVPSFGIPGVRHGLSVVRSEERRVGKECVSTCRSRWSPYH